MLLESLLTSVVIAVALTALSAALLMIIKSNSAGEASVVSAHLSQRMLEEIRLRRWDENTPTPAAFTSKRNAVGADPGETASDKRTFNDIDDFNGWAESPPKDPVMNPLAGFENYSTSVTVRYVDAGTLASTVSRTDFKRVTVCSWRAKRKSICLDTIATNR